MKWRKPDTAFTASSSSPSSSSWSDYADEKEKSAVDELIAQVHDEIILEIKTTPVSVGPLSSDLESRFESLKSSKPSVSRRKDSSAEAPSKDSRTEAPTPKDSGSSDKESNVDAVDEDLLLRELENLKLSPTSSSRSPPRGRERSVSPPPPKSSCFMCASPKKLLRSLSSKKRSAGRVPRVYSDVSRVSSGEGILSDANTFSSKSQRKSFKKAVKDEENVCREAEELVEWVKHASARISRDIGGLDFDDDDDDDHMKKF